MNLQLNEADRRELTRSLSTELKEFIPLAWEILDPGQPFVPNWHIDAICDHLEAVSSGEIRRLVINVPPGFSKSTLTSVYFPAWMWGPGKNKNYRFIGASHEQSLATRDNRRTRLLVDSEWFQEHWPTEITSDQNEKTYFENVSRGFRQSCAVKSMTGKRGDAIVWDDPQNPEQANSDVERETAIRVFTETLPSRTVDPKKSAIIIIMQRLHSEDVTGYILEHDLDYEHLMLPMEFEPERKCYTSIGFEDPRTEEDELLDPVRFPRDVVEQSKKEMREYATAGQFQQRPVPREGGMIRTGKIEIIEAEPVGCRWVRAWDFAGTKDRAAAWTVGVKMGIDPNGRFVVSDVQRVQAEPLEVERLVKNTAVNDGPLIRGSIPQDPGSAGKSFVINIVTRVVPGYPYFFSPESGDKLTRAEPFAAQVDAGNVAVVRGAWVNAYLEELSLFPGGKFMDQVDATSRGFMELTQGPQEVALKGSYG